MLLVGSMACLHLLRVLFCSANVYKMHDTRAAHAAAMLFSMELDMRIFEYYVHVLQCKLLQILKIAHRQCHPGCSVE